MAKLEFSEPSDDFLRGYRAGVDHGRAAERKRLSRLIDLAGQVVREAGHALNDDAEEGATKEHSAVFTNDTQQVVKDLHIQFDVEGVRRRNLPGRINQFPNGSTDPDNKKQLDLDGSDFAQGAAVGVGFEHDGTDDYKIEHWFWTTKDAQGHPEQIGPTHDGPPLKGDGTPNWS